MGPADGSQTAGVTRARAENILEQLDRETRDASGESAWKLRPFHRPNSRYDLIVTPTRPNWRDDVTAVAGLERIRSHVAVEKVKARDDTVLVRLTDECVVNAGEALEAAGLDVARGRELGGRYVVHFCDPNANKALHVGHMRNLAIGNALVASLSHAGADVESRSAVADCGRNMAEAMAGTDAWRRVHGAGVVGEKGDHFVGQRYREYVNANAAASAHATVDAPIAREVVMRGDAADRMLAGLLDGDPAAIELWRDVRGLVVDGHVATLRSLGIEFTQLVSELDLVQPAQTLATDAAARKLFDRDGDGMIVYTTGRKDFEALPMLRGDGAPTQHMRSVAYWVLAEDELRDVTSIQICGDEWQPHTVCIPAVLERLLDDPDAAIHPTVDVLHGMVTLDDAVLTSSDGSAQPIDHLLAELAARVEAERDRGASLAGDPEGVAAAVALGYFLTKPLASRVEFKPSRLLDAKDSLGWAVAEAAGRADLDEAAAEPAIDHPAYRFAVVQSQLHSIHLRRVAVELDPTPLARYVHHFSRWYLDVPASERVAIGRVAALVVGRGARSLGLEGAT